MANDYRMVDEKLVQLSNTEQKELDDQNKTWTNGQADRDLTELRTQRNILLSETDWRSLPDAPTLSDEWKKYRQDLRDITKTFSSLLDKDFAFPTKPTE